MMPRGMEARTIVVGEDEPEVRGYLNMALQCLGFTVELAQDGNEVLRCLESAGENVVAVLLDAMMPNRDGIEILKEIRRMDAELPVIIVSSGYAPTNVANAFQNGATDFLCKPILHEDLKKSISKALTARSAPVFVPLSRPAAPKTNAFVGVSPRMREIHSLLGQIGWSEAPVLIQGETGSGKEVLARELHAQSPRCHKPFLKLNCAALPSELIESELFGYERGAFTGAFQRKAGMFELADGGTILLDEIGDMDVRLQAKLLQVVQDQEFQRVGGKETIRVDVRIMAATHRDLERAIIERNFREDLYYRLNVITLHLPPLCERKEDILPLAEFLMGKHAGGGHIPEITLDLKHAFMTYHWPGNVRELENVVRKLLILRNPDAIAREMHLKTTRRPLLAASIAAPQAAAAPAAVEEGSPILEQFTQAKRHAESEAILAALNSTRWNRKQAAVLLKIDYKALLYKMKKLGVEEFPAAVESNGTLVVDQQN
jgi:two-component system, NtrC family, response regulator AtoC